MRIAATSDIHSQLNFEIPECDLFIIAGDLLGWGTLEELRLFCAYLKAQKYYYREAVVVPGNHDAAFEKDPETCRAILKEARATLLIDQHWTYQGISIYGSPWTPQYGNWHYMLNRGADIAERWSLIPEGLDILVTHGPPFGILDVPGYSGAKSVGCEELRRRIYGGADCLKKPPRYNIFGHIHGGYGKLVTPETTFYNVARCTEQYKPINPIVEFEIVQEIRFAFSRLESRALLLDELLENFHELDFLASELSKEVAKLEQTRKLSKLAYKLKEHKKKLNWINHGES